jgi:hypothetical protein
LSQRLAGEPGDPPGQGMRFRILDIEGHIDLELPLHGSQRKKSLGVGLVADDRNQSGGVDDHFGRPRSS